MIKKWIGNRKWKTKNYTHFDINKKFKTPEEEIIFFEEFFSKNDISKYKFKPFIRYEIKEKRFTLLLEEEPKENYYYETENKNAKFYRHKKKLRPITYASHRDSDIYSYYSFLLWEKYEYFLKKNSLYKNILAYRTVEKEVNDRIVWKNNIDFSLDIFQDILNIKDCIVFAFDISWFFDTLDHKILKNELKKVLWEKQISDDWFKVYKNITKFCYVDKEDLEKNNLIERFNKKYKFPKIINIEKFNYLKDVLKNEWTKLIKTNPEFPTINDKNPFKKNIWIPQWTPLSWMLANLYMNEFDIILKKYVDECNWKYYRYSDDILLIVPYNKNVKYLDLVNKVSEFTLNNITKKLKLQINNNKTEISIFSKWKILKNVYLNKKNFFDFKKEKLIQPFQYLWFTFDGEKVLIRNKTLSNYYKKLVQSLKRLQHLKDYKNWKNYIKWDKILLWKHNRKYLFNWNIIWKPYIKKNNKYIIDNEKKWFYLWFLSYWYNAYNIFQNFCNKNNVKNWIKKQLSWHRNKYNKFLNKYWIK
jgi:hypothetical protein